MNVGMALKRGVMAASTGCGLAVGLFTTEPSLIRRWPQAWPRLAFDKYETLKAWFMISECEVRPVRLLMGIETSSLSVVTPAKAGVQGKRRAEALDARFRGHDNQEGRMPRPS